MLMANVNTKNSLNVKEIGVKAFEKLTDLKFPVRIEGVFDNSLYINVGENELIRVIKNGEYISSTSILVNGDDQDFSFKSFGIEDGMEVVLEGGDLLISNRTAIKGFDKVTEWQPPTVPDNSSVSELEIIKLNLRVLRDVIYTCPSREGLVPLLENIELLGSIELFLKPQKESLVERARPGIERTMWGLFSYDLESVIKSVKEIIGLGPGLTPSCDDFLAGLIVSLKLGNEVLCNQGQEDKKFFRDVAEGIYREALGKSTVFSVNMLREACEGVCPLAEINLVYSLLTGGPDHVANDSKILIKMGETSGADTAIGIFYGIRFLISKLENLEVVDGTA